VPDLWIDLLTCLELESKPSTEPGTALFEGRNQQLEYHRLFGGQLLGQFIQASRLVYPGKAVKSVAAAAPAQPAARTRAQFRAGRCPHRGRDAGGLVRQGGAAAGLYLSLATTRTTFY
jgi:acyl-CoA thioesterase-2